MEDTRKELERLEQELLADEEMTLTEKELDELFLDDDLLREVMEEDAAPAFEDPDKIHEPAEPMVYYNYSNDYGKDLQEAADAGAEETAKKKNDKLIMGLMITASALCLGIVGILIYWLEAFF